MPKCSQPFHAQVAQIPRLRAMLEVERQKSNALQTEVLRFGAEELQNSQSVDKSTHEVVLSDCKLAATTLGIILSRHSKREMKYVIRKSWSGCTWKKTESESADTGGGIGDETLLIEGVGPCSLTMGDRLPLHLLNVSFSTARPGDPQARNSSNVSVELGRLVNDPASQKKGSRNT